MLYHFISLCKASTAHSLFRFHSLIKSNTPVHLQKTFPYNFCSTISYMGKLFIRLTPCVRRLKKEREKIEYPCYRIFFNNPIISKWEKKGNSRGHARGGEGKKFVHVAALESSAQSMSHARISLSHSCVYEKTSTPSHYKIIYVKMHHTSNMPL